MATSSSLTKSFIGLRILSDGSLSYTLTYHRPIIVCIAEQENEEVLEKEQSSENLLKS
jgi:hypothetical protein